MFQAVSELKAAFLERMACGDTRDDNSFCFCTFNHPGACLSEPELQYFAENFRVSAIFALRRRLRETGTAAWGSATTSVFPDADEPLPKGGAWPLADEVHRRRLTHSLAFGALNGIFRQV